MEPTFDYSDIQVQQRTVKYKGDVFILTEATEQAACVYRRLATQALKMADGKVTGLGPEIANMPPAIVHECLFQTIDGSSLKMNGNAPIRVPLDIVNSMPTRIVRDMFDWIKKVSHLEEKEQTPEDIKEQIKTLQEKLAKLEGDGPKE